MKRYKSPSAVSRHATGWYGENTCPACGRVNNTGELCERTTECKLCGMTQCQGPSGTCKFCGCGLLEGYVGSNERCQYVDCNKGAVAEGKYGKDKVCKEHFIHQFGEEEIPTQKEVDKAAENFT